LAVFLLPPVEPAALPLILRHRLAHIVNHDPTVRHALSRFDNLAADSAAVRFPGRYFDLDLILLLGWLRFFSASVGRLRTLRAGKRICNERPAGLGLRLGPKLRFLPSSFPLPLHDLQGGDGLGELALAVVAGVVEAHAFAVAVRCDLDQQPDYLVYRERPLRMRLARRPNRGVFADPIEP
jgi:hypothetical protein